jgi:hypothetical protein
MVAISVARQEAQMANKDKGGGHSKKTAVRDLKQKRADKKAKKAKGN